MYTTLWTVSRKHQDAVPANEYHALPNGVADPLLKLQTARWLTKR